MNKITLYDYSDYVSGKHNDGGCYGFWTEYIKQDDKDEYDVFYNTTADMEYCPYCGTFGGHCDCEEPYTVTKEELEKIIKDFEESHKDDENYWIERKGEKK